MLVSGGLFAFEIPAEWWEAAGMVGFRRGHRQAYRRGQPGNPDNTPIVLRVDEIAIGPHKPELDRDRMVDVLTAIRLDHALPPIDVTRGDDFTHTLYHGRHRLAASIAVGFALVPAVIVRSLDEIKRSERIA